MIEVNRPICVEVPVDYDRHDSKHRDLSRQIAETIDTEGDMYDESHVPGRFVDACSAEWSKNEFDENGKKLTWTCGLTSTTLDIHHYVKCMEPAIYYMSIPHAMGGGSFCKYHKPRVSEI